MRISDWSSDVCSSDLQVVAQGTPEDVAKVAASYTGRYLKEYLKPPAQRETVAAKKTGNGKRRDAAERSEEHTSELQSLMRISYAVFCLKKKNKKKRKQNRRTHTPN